MATQEFVFKKDKYRRNRGGNSRFLNVFCDGCKGHLALYQKDGPGELKRMYVDRIHAPVVSPKKQNFVCPSCDRVIGTFFIYKKEDRPAIRLYQGSIFKKITKGVYPPQK
jgi:hypothetical protein